MNNATLSSVLELKQTGLKATLPRMRVLQLFQQGTRRHWAADDIYRALHETGADIGLATVYRVLTQFEQAGVLRRSRFDADRAVYELDDGAHHDHLVCLRCGRVEEFHDAEIEQRQRALAATRGFKLVEHTLALYGLCTKADCAEGKP